MFGKGSLGNIYYYGSETYKYINRVIDNKGEILIVSPYVDGYYAEIICRKSRGRKFYIISSSVEDDVLRRLRGRSLQWLIAYLGLSAILLGFLLFISVSGILLLIAPIPFIVGIIKTARNPPGVILKVPKKFVHAKMYISDGVAITGSTNLTYAGTHKNVEQISIIYNKADIGRLKDQFWSMWESSR